MTDPRFTQEDPGPPPVTRALVAAPAKATATYEKVTSAFSKNSPDMKAVRAMLGKDPALAERFMGVVFSLLAKQSDLLAKATPESLVQAVKDLASLGLEPFTGEAAIVEYGGIATVLVEYRGQLRQIRNSGLVRNVDCQVVYDRDEFAYGWDRQGGWFKHTPFQAEKDEDGNVEDRGGFRYWYAYAIMNDGFCMLEVMTEAEVQKVRAQYSRAGGNRVNAWRDAPGEMGRKTVLRRLRKRLPTSPQMQVLNRLDSIEDEREAPAPPRSPAADLALAAVSGEPE